MIDFKEQAYIALNTVGDGKTDQERLEELLERIYEVAFQAGQEFEYKEKRDVW